MAKTIALAGKGGVGKTTICGLLITYLAEKRKGAILAVDADANSNLNEVLGLEIETTLGDIREEMEHAEDSEKTKLPGGMTKAEYAEMQFMRALAEGDDFDLLVMGRTQGAGCYCFVNGILSAQVAKYSGNYSYVVVDNEAGMEHISRGILPKVDVILMVSDCSVRGVQAAAKIFELAKSLKLGAKEMKLIINRAPASGPSENVLKEVEKAGMEILCVLPQDETVYEYDADARPTTELPKDNEFRKQLYQALDELNL